MRTNLPPKEYFLNKSIPGHSDYIVIEHVDSGMNAHMFKAYNKAINSYFACKVIPKSNLINYEQDPEEWKGEVIKANQLDIDTVVKYFHVSEWEDKENAIDCVALCANFIKGENLERYIKSHKMTITMPFIEDFLLEMFNFFNAMAEQKMTHGDLHTKNILVEDNSSSLRGPAYRFRVTDFGVASKTSNASFKDDYEQLAIILRSLLENNDYQKSDPREKFVYNALNNDVLSRHLIERDHTRDPLAQNPSALFRKVQSFSDDFMQQGSGALSLALKSPFDYPSLEQFGDSYQLLKELYSELFLGLSKIEERNNLVLTGPRGCGKSTSFKSLSMLNRIRVDTDAPNNISYVGIYYRCDDLYFAFPRYKLPQREEAYDLPLHFLTASLLVDVLKAVQEWGQKRFQVEWERNETRISAEIWAIMRLVKPNEPGCDTFRAIINKLNRERERAAQKQRFANDLKHDFGYYFGPEILSSICEKMKGSLPFLQNLPFFFFIDDYSMPKISEDLQKNLNRLLMQRTASSFFKIATESPVSYVRNDIDGKNYVEGREFALLNLGIEYIHAEKTAKLQFIEDIFIRRFKAISDYPVKNLGSLLGDSDSKTHNEMAIEIRNKRKPLLGGKDTLCDLCSGDIHYIINLVGNMVQSVGGKDGLSRSADKQINLTTQNKAIRDEAGNFLKNLIRLPGGDNLVQIVTAFGYVAHHYLLHRDAKNEQSRPPHQASRIEPLEQLNLSTTAKKIYDDLLRYSVFIEDLRGKSRRGDVVPRLYLRRFLIPHFNLTFSTRDSIQVEPAELEILLTAPKEFEKKVTKKKATDLQTDLDLNGEADDDA